MNASDTTNEETRVRDLLHKEHAQLVQDLEKSPEKIIFELTYDKISCWHMATGIAGEAGELLDAVKKYAIYDRSVDLENIVEELGDLEFYMQGLRVRLGITREEVLEANIRKLRVRYGKTYSNEAAAARLDKANAASLPQYPGENTDTLHE